ncbi:enoyl-CoA hydratase-related protein [Sphingomonas sp. BIUV-7]|uniref:Enoyl-CoA hydratase-related protein n=1 Tax=Sphingomonas natans TaxID=3063330 RepID=A0ABT8Y6Y3_9SPHN|nr:enoyl-CoA hydratase-related protein [Sphingomonas sp. BIUV-7]MDO6414083.1 enoyl-CoA hydratase-related protein [Sphingomonas sp. BIUV-7]
MSEPPVLLSIDHAIATLTLNRPAAGNAIDLPLAQALLQAAIRCDSDPAIRCVVLTGAGKLFCGGGDIAGFATTTVTVPAYLSELAGTLHMAVTRLMRMAKPLLVLVNGPAAGAGLGLAICGDVVLAAQSAHFTAAYGGVGLSPDGGVSWLLPRLIGLRRAQEMLIANRRVGAEEAAAIGLVTRIVSDDDLIDEGLKQARTLAAAATNAVAAARALLLESYGGSLEGQLERETRSIAALSGTADSREGVAAFFDRRKPVFSGGA